MNGKLAIVAFFVIAGVIHADDPAASKDSSSDVDLGTVLAPVLNLVNALLKVVDGLLHSLLSALMGGSSSSSTPLGEVTGVLSGLLGELTGGSPSVSTPSADVGSVVSGLAGVAAPKSSSASLGGILGGLDL
ncbi:hypothetical protein QR680_010190 [Steinernema hermaphroditum]|uniref:Uncharacterized protein n=1 Tax=Steinernema hermaphroditum TaxID=289476 RepID=A0AA39IPB1_9BILA|nr:hypothetical protein QR680_010190 [Steinernema hermaphroditum]